MGGKIVNNVSSDCLKLLVFLILGIVIGLVTHVIAVQLFEVNYPMGIVAYTSSIAIPAVSIYTFKQLGFKFSKGSIFKNNSQVDFLIIVIIIISAILIADIVTNISTGLFEINEELLEPLRIVIKVSISGSVGTLYLFREKIEPKIKKDE